MILNEDFFNDIEIKDDDPTVEQQPVEEYNEKTSRELIEHEISESEMILVISIDTFAFHIQFNIWHRIECVMKRLKYLFGIYNINLSESFLMYEDVSLRILKNKKFPVNCTLIQHEGCNLYFPEDELRKYGPDKVIMKKYLKLFVFLDKKLPVFKTARNAYNFLIGLDKCLWKDITDPKNDCFDRCDLYNINELHYNLIGSLSESNSYVNDSGREIFYNIIRLVPEELGNQLKETRKLLQLAKKQLKKEDLNTIIKLADQ